MKRSNLLKLLALMLSVIMLVSVFAACGEDTETTETPGQEATEAPTQAPTEPEATQAPTEPEATQAPTEPEVTQAPTEPETTQAPTEPETTEAPTEPETTQAPTEPETTEAPTEPETTEAPTEPETTEAPTDPETTETPCETPHEYETDSKDHWKNECPDCDYEGEEKSAHTYEKNTGVCSVCGYKAACNGEHGGWQKDDDSHFIPACEYCGWGTDVAHSFDYNDDGVYCCLVCSYEPECKDFHWTWDETFHYQPACKYCDFEGDPDAESPHLYFVGEDGKYACDTCGFVPECGGVHEYVTDAEGHSMATCGHCGAEAVEKAPHKIAETVEGNTFKYSCIECSYVAAQKILPESVTAYVSPDMMAKKESSSWLDKEAGTATKDGSWVSTTHHNMTSESIKGDNVIPYFSFTKGNSRKDGIAQFIWNRDAAYCSSADKGAAFPDEKFTNNVGKAKYLVIKMRVADNTQDFGIVLSTLGTSGAVKDYAVEVWGYGVYGDGRTTGKLPIDAAEAGTWVTYALDLELVFGDSYNPSADGTYDIDNFYFHIVNKNEASAIDIEYIAFIENDAEGLNGMVNEDVYYVVTAKDGSYITVDKETNTCKDNKHINGDCDTECDICGTDGLAAGQHTNLDCDDEICDICNAEGVKGVAHVNKDCGDDKCDNCEATGIAGPAHVNKDCDDEICDVCEQEGVVARAPHVNATCEDEECDLCGFEGIAKGPHTMSYTSLLEANGDRVCTVVCVGCGFEYSMTVPASVNYYAETSVAGPGFQATVTYNLFDSEANILYNKYSSAKGAHYAITGGSSVGTVTPDKYAPGSFIVIKYRVNAPVSYTFFAGTNVDTNARDYKSLGALDNSQRGVWRVAVVDVTAFEKWSTEESTLYFQITSGGEGDIDIAYVATVDTLDEIASIETSKFFYFHGDSFEKAATIMNTADASEHAHTPDPESENIVENADGSKTYEYTCTECGAVYVGKTETPEQPGEPESPFGTKDAPLSVSDALDKYGDLESGKATDEPCYVQGTVTSIGSTGSYYQKVVIFDGAEEILIFKINMGDGITGFGKGDTIIAYGYIMNYEGTIELSSYKPEGATESIYVYAVSVVDGCAAGHKYPSTGLTAICSVCDYVNEHTCVDSDTNSTCDLCGAAVAAAGETVVNFNVVDYATEQGWTIGGQNVYKATSFTLDSNITMTIAGGNNSGKIYSDGVRIYATDSPAGTVTITAADGYTIKSVKVITAEGTYAFLQVSGNSAEDLSNVLLDVNASSITFSSVKNGDGKQVRISAIEVIYAES